MQFAKWKGAHVIGTASAANVDFVHSLGADEVIDYKTTPFETVVRDADVVLDTLGGDTQERSYGVLKPGGILVATAAPPEEAKAKAHGVRALMMNMKTSAAQLAEIAQLLDAGQVKTVVSQVFSLGEARQAQELSQKGHTQGKIVLHVQP